ncbi:MAG: FUSC family protein [Acidobacteria bacterium]|nr:FUSC family protein [Acidobacteriota bacterium]
MRPYRSDLFRVMQVTGVRPAYAAGLRAAVATVVPIVVGASLGWSEALWMGLSGFNTSLGDKGGPWRVRARAMLFSLVFGAVAVFLGALAGRKQWSAVVGMALVAILAGLARSWGPAAVGAGIVSMATYIVSIAYPAPHAMDLLLRPAAVVAGGIFAILLAVLSAPNRPYRPARAAVARAFRALAVGDRDAAQQAILEARMTLAALRRGQNAESVRGERLLVLADHADRIRSSDAPPPPGLESVANAIENERVDELVDADQELRDAVRELNEGREIAAPLDLRDVARNLTWSSVILRHALRVALASAAAVAITAGMHIERGYWLTLSVIIVLQPYTSSTFQKGLQRVGGTVGGGLIAALLLALVHSHAQMIALIFIGAACTVALLPLNYTLYSLFLTPTFILLAEVNATDWHLVWLRVGNTFAGAALAYLAAWLLWPASERGLVRDELAEALRALAEYARCVGECDDALVGGARRAFHVALENAEASLQRLLGDAPPAETEGLMSLLTQARRFALALSALASSAPERFRIRPLTAHAGTVLYAIAAGTPPAAAPPPTIRGTERLRDALDGMQRAAERLEVASP